MLSKWASIALGVFLFCISVLVSGVSLFRLTGTDMYQKNKALAITADIATVIAAIAISSIVAELFMDAGILTV